MRARVVGDRWYAVETHCEMVWGVRKGRPEKWASLSFRWRRVMLTTSTMSVPERGWAGEGCPGGWAGPAERVWV